MNTEDYVNFETAASLKQKGFNWGCISYYEHFSSNVTLYSGMVPEWSNSYIDHNKIDGRYSRPTLQMAMKWLREVHNIHINICSIWDVAHWIYQVFVITPRTASNSYVDEILYTSYEQACNASIKYCLENLI